MGRKANPKTNKTGFGKASESIAKAFGDGVVINGQHIIEHPPEIISVSPALDAALGGGFIVGSMVTIAGHPRCGKTTISLHFAAKWQALGRRVVYLNAEQRLNPRDIVGVPGLKPEEFIVITSTRGRILTAQDYWDIAYTYLCEETDVLLIIDSVSVLSEERERTGGMGTETRGGSAKLLAQFCRLATPVIPVNSHVVIGIAHLYANTSGMGRKYLVAMGQKADYALSTMLYSEKTETWTAGSDEDAKQIGQINHSSALPMRRRRVTRGMVSGWTKSRKSWPLPRT
jgi:RecA/RadA recombinase